MKSIKEYPSQAELLQTFTYCESGNLYWKESGQGRQIHRPVGSTGYQGYRQVQLNESRYQLHRIIYIMHYGSIPDGMVIDHIDGQTGNNRLENLQALSVADNGKKRSKNKRNKSGFKGVSFNTASGKWVASMRSNKKHIHLGYFNNIEDAVSARKDAENEVWGTLSLQYDLMQEYAQ